jgi:hypothetical protein
MTAEIRKGIVPTYSFADPRYHIISFNNPPLGTEPVASGVT